MRINTLLAAVALAPAASTFLPLLPAVAAQTVVVPDGLATAEGDSLHHVPGYYGPNRVQALYRATVLTGLGSRSITRVHARRDGPSATPFAAHTWRVTLHMSSKDVPAPEVSCATNYNRNRGSDWAMVLNDKPVSWPATVAPAAPPAAFTVTIPLDTPFSYAAGNNLLLQWDCVTTSGNPEAQPWYVDAQSYAGGDSNGTFTEFGTGCPPAQTFGGAAPGPMGGTLSWFWYSDGGYGVPAAGLLGESDRQWGAVQLPFDLGALGASGCTLYTDLLVTVNGRTDQSGVKGRFRVDAPVPCNQILANHVFFVQTVVLDPTFNQLGMRVSPAAKAVIGPLPPPLEARVLYSYDIVNSTGRISDVPLFAAKLGLVLGLD